MASDIYKILDVGKHATTQEIRAAYLRLASEMHPDLNSQDAAAELRFKEVQTAYEVLANPLSRAEYDRHAHRRRSRPVVQAGASPNRATPRTTTSAHGSAPWERRADFGAGFQFMNRAAMMRAKHHHMLLAAAVWVTVAVVAIVGMNRWLSQADVPAANDSDLPLRHGDDRVTNEQTPHNLGVLNPLERATHEPDVSSSLPLDQTTDANKQETPAVPPHNSAQFGGEKPTTFEFVSGLPRDSQQLSLPVTEIDAFAQQRYDAEPIKIGTQSWEQFVGQHGRVTTTNTPGKGFRSDFSFVDPEINDGWNALAAHSVVGAFPWEPDAALAKDTPTHTPEPFDGHDGVVAASPLAAGLPSGTAVVGIPHRAQSHAEIPPRYENVQQMVGADARLWARLPEEERVGPPRAPWHVGYLRERWGQLPASRLAGQSPAPYGNSLASSWLSAPNVVSTPPGFDPHDDTTTAVGVQANTLPASAAREGTALNPYGNVGKLSATGTQSEGFGSRPGDPYRQAHTSSMVIGWGSAPEYRMPTLRSVVPRHGNSITSPGGTAAGSAARGPNLGW